MSTERDFMMRGDLAKMPQPTVAEVSVFNIFAYQYYTKINLTATPQGILKSVYKTVWRILSQYNIVTLIKKDHLGDWSPEKDCCLRLTFQQPVRKP